MIFSKGFILPSPSHPVALRIEERTKGATTKVVKLEKNCTPLLSPLSSLLSTLPPSFQTLLTEILHSFNLNEMVVRVGREGVGFVRSFVRLTL